MANTTQAQADRVILTVTDAIFSDDTGADVPASMERFADILETQVERQLGDRILNLEIRTHRGSVNESIIIYGMPEMTSDDERDLRASLTYISEQVLNGTYGDWAVEASN